MLMDVEQVEFVRGPQSALFGRNSLGGLINVTSARPSLTAWTGSLTVPLGSRAARDVRGSISGPLVSGRLGLGLSMAYERRDGFTRNDVTGADLDRRSAFSGKGQLHWAPSGSWEARLIVTGERARDGDYALNDLGALRETPFHAARDFEGHTDRDILATTILTRREGRRVSFSTTTGLVRWKTVDATDLDYSPAPLVRRDNTERDLQFTQEVRMASAPGAPVALSDAVSLRWQGGVFLFTQDYRQNAVNDFAPFLLSQFLGFPVSQTSPIDARGLGRRALRRATATVKRSVDLAVGAPRPRAEGGGVRAFFAPIAPQTHVTAERASPTSPRSRSPNACGPSGWSTRSSGAAKAADSSGLPAGSRPTAKSARGTSNGASRARGPAAG
jgi:iron complex outermembrane receptor protein